MSSISYVGLCLTLILSLTSAYAGETIHKKTVAERLIHFLGDYELTSHRADSYHAGITEQDGCPVAVRTLIEEDEFEGKSRTNIRLIAIDPKTRERDMLAFISDSMTIRGVGEPTTISKVWFSSPGPIDAAFGNGRHELLPTLMKIERSCSLSPDDKTITLAQKTSATYRIGTEKFSIPAWSQGSESVLTTLTEENQVMTFNLSFPKEKKGRVLVHECVYKRLPELAKDSAEK
ncbi:MAG: hypothetical protein AB7P04_04065 [Bacteriovoracia bacterium]